jgi:hypothetical protein
VPNAVNIRDAFRGCSALKSIVLPKVESLQSNAFDNCSNLEMVDLHKVASIGSSVFYGDRKLKTVIIRSPELCALSYTNAFGSNEIITVYVHYDFIDAYENATNWSSLVANGKVTFEALEGSGYD